MKTSSPQSMKEARATLSALSKAKADKDLIQDLTTAAITHLDQHGDYDAIGRIDALVVSLFTKQRVEQWRAYVQSYTWVVRDANGRWSKSKGKTNNVAEAAKTKWYAAVLGGGDNQQASELAEILDRHFARLQRLIDDGSLCVDGKAPQIKDIRRLTLQRLDTLRTRELTEMIAGAKRRFAPQQPNAPEGMKSGLRGSPFVSGGLPSLGKKR